MCRFYRTMLWSLMTSLKEATGKLRCSGPTTETLTSLSLKDSQHGAESPLPAVTSPCRLTDKGPDESVALQEPWCNSRARALVLADTHRYQSLSQKHRLPCSALHEFSCLLCPGKGQCGCLSTNEGEAKTVYSGREESHFLSYLREKISKKM